MHHTTMSSSIRAKYVVAGLILGVFTLAAFRFAFSPPEPPTHYHANFALFVNGARVDLSGDEYMEEVGACNVGDGVAPTERAHLHGNDPDVAHVHHEGVTWGHLFANLGFALAEGSLAMDDGRVLTNGSGRSFKSDSAQLALHWGETMLTVPLRRP